MFQVCHSTGSIKRLVNLPQLRKLVARGERELETRKERESLRPAVERKKKTRRMDDTKLTN